VTNTIATTGGMVCDGAKPSCASKIAMALDNMIMAINMSKEGRTFHQGEGLVGSDVEETVRNIGRMARQGMKNTDTEILNIMIEN
jgi:L-cysteine desulfidase